jgi:hypothetical protein
MYDDENPVNAVNTPKINHLVETLLSGKIGECAKSRKDNA